MGGYGCGSGSVAVSSGGAAFILDVSERGEENPLDLYRVLFERSREQVASMPQDPRKGIPCEVETLNGYLSASSFCSDFFSWYNTCHYHSGIAYLTPEMVHYGQA